MKLARFNNAISPHGYLATRPTEDDLSNFFWDIDAEDRFEIKAITGSCDWQAALRVTFETSTMTAIVRHPDHEGTAVFGLLRQGSKLAQVWMLQSRTFVAAASAYHGPAWPRIACRLTAATIKLSGKYDYTLYNYIPKSQTRNIRWLKMGGFRFFTHPQQACDILMFCHGQLGTQISQNSSFWQKFDNPIHPSTDQQFECSRILEIR